MANKFVARKGLVALANSEITGSVGISQNLIVNQSISGSLTGSLSGSLIATGELTGSLTGSIQATGNLIGTLTGSVSGDVTGSLLGTAATASYVGFDSIDNKPTLLSSSAQIASDISGSSTALSSSLAGRIGAQEQFSSSIDDIFATEVEVLAISSSLSGSLAIDIATNDSRLDTLEGKTILSSSAQIAPDISGSSTALSSSLAGRIGAQELFSSSIDDIFATEVEVLNISSSLSASLAIDIATNDGRLDTIENKTLLSGSAQIATDISGSLGTNATLIRSLTATGITGSFTSLSSSIASDINTKLNFADTGSFAKTNVNNSFSGIQNFDNINVNGTASFNFINSVTGSATYIGEQYVVVNASTEGARFAGIQVYDSESALQHTASLAWDSLRNHWVYANPSGSYHGGGLISGPRNSGSLGDETYPSYNYIVRGQGGDHIYDSNIIDNDTAVKIGINTEITGSLLTTGNVGIGTSSPTANLHILDAVTPSIKLEDTTNSNEGRIRVANNYMYIDIDNPDTVGSSRIVFMADSTQSLYLTDTNAVFETTNVGIGTTSPSRKLDVSGSAVISNQLLLNSPNYAEHLAIRRGEYGYDTIVTGTRIDFSPTAATNTFQFLADVATTGTVTINPSGNAVLNINGTADSFIEKDTGNTLYVANNVTDKDITLRVRPGGVNNLALTVKGTNGNIGIGTTSPSQKLHIEGNARITGALHDSNNSAGTSGQVLSSTATGTDWVSLSEISGVDGSGTANYVPKWTDGDTIGNSIIYDNGTNIGIGTSSPASLLQVGSVDSQSGNATLTVRRNGSGIEFGHNNRTSGYYGTIGSLSNAGTPYIAFSADNDEFANSFTTRGFKGNVINSTTAGDLTFNQLTNSNASGQFLTERMRIDSSGNVGIGTTDPTYKFEVSNGTQVGTFNPNSGGFMFLGSTSNHPLYFGVNDQTKMALLSNGNVGIGTTSPSQKLSVEGGNIKLNNNNADANYYLFLNKKEGKDGGILLQRDNNLDWQITNLNVNGDLNFYSYGGPASVMRIQRSTGNVGIDNTSPLSKLQVGLGTTNQGSTVAMLGAAEAGILSALSLVNTTGNTSAGYGTALDFHVNSAYSPTGRIATLAEDTSTPAALAFYTYNSGLNEKMRITSAGNVGIGTTNPTEALMVEGWIRVANNTGIKFNTSASSGDPTLNIDSSANWNFLNTAGVNLLKIDNGGNVGIGTTSPNTRLEVFTDDDLYGTHLIASTNTSSVLSYTGLGPNRLKYYRNTVTGVNFEIQTSVSAGSSGGNIIFAPNNGDHTPTEKVRIQTNGNVGIGTTSPQSKLHLTGAITISDVGSANNVTLIQFTETTNYDEFSIKGDFAGAGGENKLKFTTDLGGGDILTMKGDGNVGIGTTNPTANLEIYGSGSTVLDIQGSQGQLFSVTDDLTGTIFAASDISGIPILEVDAAGTVTVDGTLYSTGDIVAYSSSDRELKDNIVPIANAVEKVSKLGGYEFDWNDKQNVYTGHDYGVIAQEVEEVLPELVNTRNNGYKAVNYEKIVPILIESIKELKAEIEELKAKL